MKRGTSSRRLRPGHDVDRLFALIERLPTDAELTPGDRAWLWELLLDIASDIDVRGRFYRTVRGAPADQDRKFMCALWIANRDEGVTITSAKAAAVRHWRMTPDQVRIAWRAHRDQAVALVGSSKSRQGLARVVEYHRTRGRNPA
jgi:hypothetical protein